MAWMIVMISLLFNGLLLFSNGVLVWGGVALALAGSGFWFIRLGDFVFPCFILVVNESLELRQLYSLRNLLVKPVHDLDHYHLK
jgi:hypothetical protein